MNEQFLGLLIFLAFAYGVYYLVKRKKEKRLQGGGDGGTKPGTRLK